MANTFGKMKFECYICGKEFKDGEHSTRVEGKLLCKKCEERYWQWLYDMHH